MLTAGTRLGSHEVLALLGQGGMGEVYQAHDTKLERDVAIKVLPEAFAHDPQRLPRFQREAKVLASLNHPNIATIHGLEESSGTHYLVMELVPGETLRERIVREGVLPVEEALGMARQIAEALEAAHEKSIIHRDLKPANVKVTPEGKVKVLDFGLAKAFAGDEFGSDPSNSPTLSHAATMQGVILGTAAYMSPEQAVGKPVDRRGDIWSFGVVLFEMLTGRRLFNGETISHVIADVIKGGIDLCKLPSSTPNAIRDLLKRCLDRDLTNRLQWIGEARIAIQKYLANPASAPSVTTAGPSRSGLSWVVSGVAVLIAVVLGFGWWRATRPIEQPLSRFSVDLGPEAVAGPRITAAISPDGRRLTFVARGAGGKEQLATRLLDQANPTFLAGTENAADPFFSPDGQWIGFFADGKMKKVSVQGGAAVTLCDAPGGRGAAWGEDGNIVATLNNGISSIGLSRVPASGGTAQALTRPGEQGDATQRWPQILPGGQAVLLTGNKTITNFDEASIEVLSLKTGQVKVVQRGGYFGRYLRGGYLVYLHQGTLFGAPFDLDRLEVRGAPAALLEDVGGSPTTGGGQLDFSRNGTLVYLSGKSSSAFPTVVWLDSASKTQPLLPPGTENYLDLRVSPDGKRLAVSNGLNNIQVFDWGRDTMTRLTFTAQQNRFPVWTPDGRHIAFQSLGAANFSLQWTRADGAGEAQRLLESKNELRPYSFSPGGKRLAFAELNGETGYDIWTLPLDSSDPEHPKPGKPELFLRTAANEYEPAFSPDGRWIAYRSNESGRDEIYVRPVPGGGPPGSGKWLISTGGGQFPIWSRAGRELFYESLDNRIMTVSYSAKGDSFDAEKPRPWSNTQLFDTGAIWNLDLSPDGKRFAVIPRPEATSEQKGSVHVTVLLNFFDELRRRVPAGK